MHNVTDDKLGMLVDSILEAAPGIRVSVTHDHERDAHVLTLRTATEERFGEVELSAEALADLKVERILEDLQMGGALDRRFLDPSIRRSYLSDRTLTNGEVRVVECDGSTYLIERDRSHSVTIRDAAGTRLPGMPQGLVALPVSIHRRTDSDWRHEIRIWRDG